MVRESIVQIAKSTLATIVFALIYVLIFTLIIQLGGLSVSVIKPVNQVFKILAVAFGGLLFIRGEKGYLKGLFFGLGAVVATYILFGIISGDFSLTWLFAVELVVGSVCGLITGIIAVNIKKS